MSSKALDGPGGLLCYTAKSVHHVKVPRDLIHNIIAELDLGGLAIFKKKEKKENKNSFHLWRALVGVLAR